jgi:uncharacterized protein YjiK
MNNKTEYFPIYSISTGIVKSLSSSGPFLMYRSDSYIALAIIVVVAIIIYLPLRFLSGNEPERTQYPPSGAGARGPYRLDQPERRYELPSVLEEVSGLSFISPHTLACIDDEKGKVYFFDLRTGKIRNSLDFGRRGDFEGVELVGDMVWILRSDGRLKRLPLSDTLSPGTPERFDTGLGTRYDAEGLGFDPVSGKVLIAVKENPDPEADRDDRLIFSVEPESGRLMTEPFLVVRAREVEKKARALGIKAHSVLPFKPSGLAVHPLSGDLYLIASVGKVLLVLDRSGRIKHLLQLDPALFRQPEGICFSPGGTLYIASEGRGKKGYVLEYVPE